MQSTLTLQEEQLAKNLKAQGKSTQEIMGAIAQSRTAKITPQREVVEKQENVFSQIAKDIPSDFMEMGAGVKESVARSGQRLGDVWRNQDVNAVQKFAATGPQLAKSVLDVAGEGLVGYGKMLTTDEFEKNVAKKIGETGQVVVDSEPAKKLSAWYRQQDPDTQFMLSQIIAPTAEVAIEGVTAGGGKVATEVVGTGIKKVGNEVVDVASDFIKPAQTDVITAPLPPNVKADIVSAYDTAIKPNLISKQTPMKRAKYEAQVAQVVESITNNVDNLKFIDETTGETVSKLPENLKELVEAMEQTKQTIFKQYDDIASKAGEMQAKVDTVRVANSLDEIINSKSLKLSNPESISYAQGVRDRLLSTRNLSAIDAQNVIKNYNNSLDAFYRNPTPEGLTRNAVDALVANQLRRSLDDEIEAVTGAQYQAIKNEYAAMKAVERDIMRAYNRDARKNVKGLIDFTDVLSAGQVISGILSMNPAMIGQGLGQKVVAGAIKMVNDPNRKVKQIFQEAGRYKRPATGMETPSRRQLPAPAEDAVRSEVGSGAPIQVGGQTAKGKVTPGITERSKQGSIKQPETGDRKPDIVREKKDIQEGAREDVRAQMIGRSTSAGDGLARTTDDGYTHFSDYPTWIDQDLRKKDLVEAVWKHIDKDTMPSDMAGPTGRLYAQTQEMIKKREFDYEAENNNWLNNSGSRMTLNDIPFSYALAIGGAGAAYYYLGDDISFPVAGVMGMMALTPATRLKLINRQLNKLEIAEAKLLRDGAKRSDPAVKSIVTAHNKLTKERDNLPTIGMNIKNVNGKATD